MRRLKGKIGYHGHTLERGGKEEFEGSSNWELVCIGGGVRKPFGGDVHWWGTEVLLE